MEDNKPVDLKKINFYKIGFFIALVLLAFFLGVVFHAKFVSASWPLGKAETCVMFNVTEPNCTQTWCGIIDCPYNSSLEACICTQIVNNTIYINETINQSICNSSFYFNESLINQTIALLLEADRNNTRDLRDSLVNRTEQFETRMVQLTADSKTYINPNPSLPWYAWVIMVVAVMGGLYFIVQSNNNKKQQIEGQQLRRKFEFTKKEEPILTKKEEAVNTEKNTSQQQKQIPWYMKVVNRGSPQQEPIKQEKVKPKKKKKDISEEEQPIEEMPEEEFNEEQESEIE